MTLANPTASCNCNKTDSEIQGDGSAVVGLKVRKLLFVTNSVVRTDTLYFHNVSIPRVSFSHLVLLAL